MPKVRGIYFVCSWKQRKVRDIISNVVDLVMEAKGSKKGLADLFSSQMYQQISASLRVVDWVLLYFKLKTRLPDNAWQTLLNLTQLGKSGVSKNYILLHFYAHGREVVVYQRVVGVSQMV